MSCIAFSFHSSLLQSCIIVLQCWFINTLASNTVMWSQPRIMTCSKCSLQHKIFEFEKRICFSLKTMMMCMWHDRNKCEHNSDDMCRFFDIFFYTKFLYVIFFWISNVKLVEKLCWKTLKIGFFFDEFRLSSLSRKELGNDFQCWMRNLQMELCLRC